MLQVEMSASVRNSSGKGPMRQLRMEGMTPAVVYGAGNEALKLQMDTKSLMAKLLKFYRRNTIVTLNIENEGSKSVKVGEVQTDPVRDTLVHVDFCEIDLEKEHSYTVPVVYEGTPKGVDLGGILEISCTKVVLRGKPLDIPDTLTIDIRGLAIGAELKCDAFPAIENVKMVTNPKTIAVTIVKPLAKAAAEDAPKDKKKKK
jgi:large subunit ribosomal protein L25